MEKTLFLSMLLYLIGCQLNLKKEEAQSKSDFYVNEETTQFTKKVFNLANPNEKRAYKEWLRIHLNKTLNDSFSLKYGSKKILVSKKEKLGRCHFEDEDFEIYIGCNGEFGGYVIFKDKKTNKHHYIECTCLKMIDFINGDYYITETLAHGSGFASIKKISNPSQLVEINIDSLYLGWQAKRFPQMDRHQIYEFLESQGQALLDTVGITINMFYPYKNQKMVIYSDYDNTYWAELKDKKLIIRDTLLKQRITDGDDSPNKIVSGYYTSHFNRSTSFLSQITNQFEPTDEIKGDIFIKSDTIVIGYKGFKKK
jgi:hypothetical protein